MSSRALSHPTAPPPRYWRKACKYLRDADPVLAEVIAAARADALRPRQDAFFSLARSIIGQQISVKAAESIWQRMFDDLGEMTPAALADAGADRLRGCGVTRQKSGYLVDLAAHFMDGSLDVDSWAKLDDEAVIGQLIQVKGIGRWTAEMFLIFYLLRPDVLPLGDIGVQRAMRNLYADGDALDAEQMTEIAEPWRPWRSVATWYMWRSLDAVPVDY